MSLRVTRFEDSDAFLARAGGFLLEREALHTLVYSIAAEARGHPEPYLVAVEHDDAIVLAAVRTSPHNLVLSRSTDEAALEVLARDLRNVGQTPPGVHGPKQEAAEFVELWTGIGGCRTRARMAQRIHQLTSVSPPEGVEGSAREAVAADIELLKSWSTAFVEEALPGETHDDQAWAARQLGAHDRGVFLWEIDGEPVSMASYSGPTPNGIRIGGVYTPVELRRRGHASACVAALSGHLLAKGFRQLFLFTDLADPTGHRIYERLGFRPMGNVNVHTFTYGSFQE